jgi:hypothetical protein
MINKQNQNNDGWRRQTLTITLLIDKVTKNKGVERSRTKEKKERKKEQPNKL